MLAGLAAAMAVSLVDPLYPENSWLQHAPTALVLVMLPPLLRRYPLSNGAMGCITGVFLLHCLGARYSYSFVPYDDWARWLTGQTISEAFGFTRNHYDRLAHFAFGLLAIMPAREVATRHLGLSRRLGAYIPFRFVIEESFAYQVFLWLLVVLMSSASGDAYNGQQGDIFDTQKDIALAAFGAATATGLLACSAHWRRRTAGRGVHRAGS